MLDPLVSVGFLSYIHGIPELAETFYYQILRERVTNRLQNTDWTTEAIQGALSGL